MVDYHGEKFIFSSPLIFLSIELNTIKRVMIWLVGFFFLFVCFYLLAHWSLIFELRLYARD